MSTFTGVIYLLLTALAVDSWKIYGGKHGQNVPKSVRRIVKASRKELASEAYIIKPYCKCIDK